MNNNITTTQDILFQNLVGIIRPDRGSLKLQKEVNLATRGIAAVRDHLAHAYRELAISQESKKILEELSINLKKITVRVQQATSYPEVQRLRFSFSMIITPYQLILENIRELSQLLPHTQELPKFEKLIQRRIHHYETELKECSQLMLIEEFLPLEKKYVEEANEDRDPKTDLGNILKNHQKNVFLRRQMLSLIKNAVELALFEPTSDTDELKNSAFDHKLHLIKKSVAVKSSQLIVQAQEVCQIISQVLTKKEAVLGGLATGLKEQMNQVEKASQDLATASVDIQKYHQQLKIDISTPPKVDIASSAVRLLLPEESGEEPWVSPIPWGCAASLLD